MTPPSTDSVNITEELSGRTVLVTGASSGLGRAAASWVARMGGRVVLGGRDVRRLEETRGALPGGGHRTAPLDLDRLNEIPGWMQKIAADAGPLYGLVHCAGSQTVGALRYLEDAQATAALNINIAVPLILLREFRRKMHHTADDARVVFMSSVMALAGEPGRCLYGACRGAVMALVKSAAVELAPDNIRINAIAAGLVPTEGTQELISGCSSTQLQSVTAAHPLGLGHPNDVANAIGFLLKPASRWITGTTLIVDGGYLSR